jgi:hypothetical protein
LCLREKGGDCDAKPPEEAAKTVPAIFTRKQDDQKPMMMAGLLTYSIVSAFPFRRGRDSGGFETTLSEGAYSYGDSPGFSPGSLLMQYPGGHWQPKSDVKK